MAICRACNHVEMDLASFCTACGTSLNPTLAQPVACASRAALTRSCPRCGAILVTVLQPAKKGMLMMLFGVLGLLFGIFILLLPLVGWIFGPITILGSCFIMAVGWYRWFTSRARMYFQCPGCNYSNA